MNDSAMQLMARERREQIVSTARHTAMSAGFSSDRARSDDDLGRIEGRSLFRTVLGLGFALAWAIMIVAIALVMNVPGSLSKIAKFVTLASAPAMTAETHPTDGQEKVSTNSEIRDGRKIALASDVKSATSEVGR